MMVRTRMKSSLLYIFWAVTIGTAFMLSGAYAADSSQKSLTYSNKDLQPYVDSSPRELREPDSPHPKGPNKTKTATVSREQREKEYWCKKASGPRKKIQRLNDDISEKEQQLAETSRNGAIRNGKTMALNKEIAKTRKRLKYAESDLRDLEDEAYRKGVPPGWLRCQFE